MDTKHIDYQSWRLDVTLLKRVASQGTIINVNGAALTTKANIDHTELVVVAAGKDRYDVLLGSWREGNQKARLVSKVVLKKADVSQPAVGANMGFQTRPNNEAGMSSDSFNRLRERYSRDDDRNSMGRYGGGGRYGGSRA